jgi:hypothetical protein
MYEIPVSVVPEAYGLVVRASKEPAGCSQPKGIAVARNLCSSEYPIPVGRRTEPYLQCCQKDSRASRADHHVFARQVRLARGARSGALHRFRTARNQGLPLRP